MSVESNRPGNVPDVPPGYRFVAPPSAPPVNPGTRLGIVRYTTELLAELLRLPPGAKIVGIQQSFECANTVELKVEHESMCIVRNGDLVPRVDPAEWNESREKWSNLGGDVLVDASAIDAAVSETKKFLSDGHDLRTFPTKDGIHYDPQSVRDAAATEGTLTPDFKTPEEIAHLRAQGEHVTAWQQITGKIVYAAIEAEATQQGIDAFDAAIPAPPPVDCEGCGDPTEVDDLQPHADAYRIRNLCPTCRAKPPE